MSAGYAQITCDTAPIGAFLSLLENARRTGMLHGLPDLPGKLTRIEHQRVGASCVIRLYPSDELMEFIGRLMMAAPPEQAR